MRLTFTCLSEDIEFRQKLNEELAAFGPIGETKINGITGYDVLILTIEVIGLAVEIIDFIVNNMTANKNDPVKSARCVVDNKNKTISFEGYSEEAIIEIMSKDVMRKIVEEQNK